MNPAEYANYQAAVLRFLEVSGVKPSCFSNVTPHEPTVNEFNSLPCECCRRHLAGRRERYHFGTEAGLLVAEICFDCVYYLAYGQLDDLTMMDLEVAR